MAAEFIMFWINPSCGSGICAVLPFAGIVGNCKAKIGDPGFIISYDETQMNAQQQG